MEKREMRRLSQSIVDAMLNVECLFMHAYTSDAAWAQLLGC